ncbi:unnamed protein product, partial [Onchocerca ochengi]
FAKLKFATQVIMTGTDPEINRDPKNAKFQYIVDNLQQDFNKRISGIYQGSCQNLNSFLLLIEWMAISNPTLDAGMLLQRGNVIAKKVDEKLLVAPCKTKIPEQKTNAFNGDIIGKFELERINAELEILAQKQEVTNPIANQQRQETFWEQMSPQGGKLAEQLEYGISKSAELIQEGLANLVEH